MADIKITDLAAYTDPVSTDVLPIVDVGSDITKKVSIADLLENAGTGSAAAPSFSFDGDNNTGIYRPGADQVAISTNGTGRLFVDANGNVGIGTASPAPNVGNGTTLHLSGATTTTELRLTRGNGTDSSITSGSTSGGLGIQSSTHISLKTNGANERLRIDSSGKVGIGTSVPDSKLRVVDSNDNGLRIGYAGNTNYYDAPIHIWRHPSGFAERLRIDSSGNVGIGTSVTDSKLRVVDSNSNGLRIGFAGNTNYYDAPFHIWRHSSGSEHLRIDSSGRLLVGTSTTLGNNATLQTSGQQVNYQAFYSATAQAGPFVILSKSRGTQASPTIVTNNDYLGIIGFSGYDGTDYATRGAEIAAMVDGTPGSNDMPGRLVFSTTADGASSPTERLRIDSSGRLLVGLTSSSNRFHVKETNTNTIVGVLEGSGTYAYQSLQASGTTAGAVRIGANANDLVINTGSNTHLRIDSSGNVLIGGTLPASPNITLNGSDGSAEFAGNVDAGPIDTTQSSSTALGVQLSAGGLIRVQRPSNASSNTTVFQAFNGNTENITLYSGGSAQFAGNVDVGGLDTSKNDTAGARLQSGILKIQRPTSIPATAYSFQTYYGTTPKVQFSNAGNATFAGSVSIGGTAAANTIDEYEEGTWTSNVVADNNSAQTAVTASNASYIKIGNVVTCYINLTLDADDASAPAAFKFLLPFTVNTSGGCSLAQTTDMRKNAVKGYTQGPRMRCGFPLDHTSGSKTYSGSFTYIIA